MSLNSGETLQPFKPLNQLIYDSAGNLIGIQNDRANGSDLRIGGGSGVDGTFATLVATTALKLNSGATFDLYNTADQTTNYERLLVAWSGNIARLFTQYGGSGSARVLQIGTSGSAGSTTPTNYAQFGVSGAINIRPAGGSGVGPFLDAFSTLNASGGTQTYLSVVPTFNQSGTAGYTVVDINPTETATGSGTKLLQRWAVGGTEKARVQASGSLFAVYFACGGDATSNIGFTTAIGTAADVTLFRDAADTLALRRGTNAQTFRVYNTYTDSSNYERLAIIASATLNQLVSENAGTGTARSLRIGASTGADLILRAGGTDRWRVNSSGPLLAEADNSYDIGASGANRPRNLYIGSSASFGLYYGNAVYLTVATLAAAGTVARARAFVNDSTVAAAGNFGAIVAGGGANIVPVYSDGTNWRIG